MTNSTYHKATKEIYELQNLLEHKNLARKDLLRDLEELEAEIEDVEAKIERIENEIEQGL